MSYMQSAPNLYQPAFRSLLHFKVQFALNLLKCLLSEVLIFTWLMHLSVSQNFSICHFPSSVYREPGKWKNIIINLIALFSMKESDFFFVCGCCCLPLPSSPWGNAGPKCYLQPYSMKFFGERSSIIASFWEGINTRKPVKMHTFFTCTEKQTVGELCAKHMCQDSFYLLVKMENVLRDLVPWCIPFSHLPVVLPAFSLLSVFQGPHS